MLLAIDTATRTISIALHDGLRIHTEWTWQTANHHNVELSPAIMRALNGASLAPADLVGVAVAQGPGSFMGLRIGLGVAKGLAVSRRLPLFAVPTLDIITMAQPRTRGKLIGILQAGRRRICTQTYTWRRGRWRPKDELWLGKWPAFIAQLEGESTLCGEIDPAGCKMLEQSEKKIRVTTGAASLRRASYLADIGWARLREDQADDPFVVTPIYVS